MKSFNVNTLLESKFQNGQALSFLNEPLDAAHLEVRRVYSEERCFLGLAKFDRSTNSWNPEKVLTKP